MDGKKVLVAYDGSAASLKAVRIAREIASVDPTLHVTLVHVMRIYSASVGAGGIDLAVLEDAELMQEDLEEMAATFDCDTQVKVLKGTSPADLIINCANELDIDLIVMGSRGQGGVKGYLGSVSYKVVKDSPITVLIAKEDRRDV